MERLWLLTHDSHTLYHRDRDNPEHIRANDIISLYDPPRSFSQLSGFAVNIELLLRGVGGGSDLPRDFVLSKWQFSWDTTRPDIAFVTRGKFLRDSCDQPDVLSHVLSSEVNCKHQRAGYDQPLAATFEGPNGCCLTMYYAILEHALQAWVRVEVIDVNVVTSVVEYNARGSIFAKYGHFERGCDSNIVDYCKTALLNTSYPESLKVKRWKLIELSRWIVAVPAYSSLIIEADLWDISSRLKIGKGKVEFIPRHSGFATDYIRGDADYALRVMVCWKFGSKIPVNFPFTNTV